MDYKYIEQLLERYWECETTLEEESILRSFFSQDNVPGSLLPYKALFAYQQAEPQQEVLGDDFDRRILSMTAEPATVKARSLRLTQRLMPLFRAAAIVAIILTLGNAMQVAFDRRETATDTAVYRQHTIDGPSVAMSDTIRVDSVQASVPAVNMMK